MLTFIAGGPVSLDKGEESKDKFPPGQHMRYPDNFAMSSPPNTIPPNTLPPNTLPPNTLPPNMPPRPPFPSPAARGIPPSYSPNKNFPYQTPPAHPYPYTSPSSYPNQNAPSPYQNSPTMFSDYAPEDTDSNSGGRYEEEAPPAPPAPSEGEFGGLVSYFSSQREDDMDT